MKKRLLAAFCVAWVMGLTAWAFSETRVKKDADDFQIVELRAAVMEVAPDCSWVVVGETRFEIGFKTDGAKRYKTKCLTSEGEPLDSACDFHPRDRVHAKGFLYKDHTVRAVTIQKRDP
ncbi:hypothetical protein [Desulfoluna sp.]|uniref:hypothetical protein n=1 Tax=Desulfoluna sp. TaxID=2045199 RepID=UPI0026101402|nr:hypothetical protein [Desulfoluna sp.]